MPEPKPSIPRIGLAAAVQTCFDCSDRESRVAALEFTRMLMLAEIHRLEAVIGRMANRESVHHEGTRATHGKGITYKHEGPSLSEINRRRDR